MFHKPTFLLFIKDYLEIFVLKNHETPLLSVVIPAYNASAFIGSCLKSVFEQKDCPEFEVIVVDDGSTDGTYELVERDYPHVRLFQKNNGGPGSARNLAVDRARSEIVIFIDADDVMLPGRLEFQGRYMLDNPSIGLTFGNQCFQLHPDYDANRDRGICDSVEFTLVHQAHERLVVRGNFVANTACAVRREAYIKAGKQPEDVFVGEDYAMNLAIARYWPFAASRRYLTWYRQGHGGNLMASPHTYRGPLAVLANELVNHGQRLSFEAYRMGFGRWCAGANMLLRWVWVEKGHAAVLAEMETLRPLLPASLAAKWSAISILPAGVGRALRSLKRSVQHFGPRGKSAA